MLCNDNIGLGARPPSQVISSSCAKSPKFGGFKGGPFEQFQPLWLREAKMMKRLGLGRNPRAVTRVSRVTCMDESINRREK